MKIELGQAYSFIQPGIRHSQEDARFPDVDMPSLSQRVFIVCDGVGGNSKGEVASRTVCDALGNALTGRDGNKPLTEREFAIALGNAYSELKKVSTQAPDMATTMALIAFHGAGVMVAHIGDSRIYQVRPGVGIMYRSDDHSLVNAMVHAGSISPDEVESHPKRHYITRSMSCVNEERDPAAVLQITDVEPGDYFLATTDGLLGEVTDNQLEEVLSLNATDEEKVGKLKAMSKDSGDNSAVVVIPVKSVDSMTSPQKECVNPIKMGSITKELPHAGDNVISEVDPQRNLWDKIKSVFKK